MVDIELIGALASIGGVSIRDAIRFLRDRRLSNKFSAEICSYLGLLEAPDEPLCGFWRLREWNYMASSHSGRFVVGMLAVLYRDHSERRTWRGRLLLQYRKYADRFVFFSGSGFFAHHLGLCSTELYEVQFDKNPDQMQYTGCCSEICAYPRWIAHRSGVFPQLRIDHEGNLVGSYRNTGQGSTGTASFAFHQRRRWSEFPSWFQEQTGIR